MLKYSLQIALLICSLNAFVGFCQKMEDRKDVRVTDSIYTLVEEDASFPGGQTEFLKFIRGKFSLSLLLCRISLRW
jgi:hypothetical protein